MKKDANDCVLQKRAVGALLQERESIVEGSLRPDSFTSFIGQQEVLNNLSVFLQAAKTQKRVLDHVLFSGPPGLGKTTLSTLIAKEMGASLRSTTGPSLTRPGDLAAIMTTLKRGDVFFIDEIHRLPKGVEELLYSAMEDFHLDIIVGEGPGARTLRLPVAPFTLIGATTRTGLLSAPLRDRFGIPLQLTFYTPIELALVLLQAAHRLGATLTNDGAREIANRSRGTPRIALRLFKRVIDFALVQKKEAINADIANYGLLSLGVDASGLDFLDRQYLSYIAEHYGGGPVGIETLVAALAQDRTTLEDAVEPFLMQQGFVQRTPRGRQLTTTALTYLRNL